MRESRDDPQAVEEQFSIIDSHVPGGYEVGSGGKFPLLRHTENTLNRVLE
jgi:hypothetical protein